MPITTKCVKPKQLKIKLPNENIYQNHCSRIEPPCLRPDRVLFQHKFRAKPRYGTCKSFPYDVRCGHAKQGSLVRKEAVGYACGFFIYDAKEIVRVIFVVPLKGRAYKDFENPMAAGITPRRPLL